VKTVDNNPKKPPIGGKGLLPTRSPRRIRVVVIPLFLSQLHINLVLDTLLTDKLTFDSLRRPRSVFWIEIGVITHK
jgi:hypothetical protein